MISLVIGLATAFAATIAHAAFVRLTAPRSKFLSLWVIEGIALAVAFLLLESNAEAAELIVGAILSLSLIVCYLICLTGVVHDSPTLALINYMLDFGADGMPLREIETFIASHPFVGSRLNAMLDGGFLRSDGARIRIGAKTGGLLQLALLYKQLWGGARASG